MARKTPGGHRRIGIFGGSFDPPHIGHLIIAEFAREQMQLDEVFFVSAFRSPHKVAGSATPPEHRLAMIKLAVKGNKFFHASDLEIRRKGISYTVDTLRAYTARSPGAELFLIIGGDSLAELEKWKSPHEIRSLADLVVYPRTGFAEEGIKESNRGVHFLCGGLLDISSTFIRHQCVHKKSIRYLVPETVERYIHSHRLYEHKNEK